MYLTRCWVRPSSSHRAPTLAKETDPRPAYNSAQDDLKNVLIFHVFINKIIKDHSRAVREHSTANRDVRPEAV